MAGEGQGPNEVEMGIKPPAVDAKDPKMPDRKSGGVPLGFIKSRFKIGQSDTGAAAAETTKQDSDPTKLQSTADMAAASSDRPLSFYEKYPLGGDDPAYIRDFGNTALTETEVANMTKSLEEKGIIKAKDQQAVAESTSTSAQKPEDLVRWAKVLEKFPGGAERFNWWKSRFRTSLDTADPNSAANETFTPEEMKNITEELKRQGLINEDAQQVSGESASTFYDRKPGDFSRYSEQNADALKSLETTQPKTLAEANRRMGETGSGLLKDIINSEDSQGRYFAKFGFEKVDPETQQPGEDLTVIVFPEPYKRAGDSQTNRFLAITRDGPKEIRPKDVIGFKEMVSARVKYPQVKSGEGYDGDRRNITLMPVDSAGTASKMPFGEDKTFGEIEDMDLTDSGVSSTVQRVIQENIQATEAPIKKVVQQTTEMGNLRNFVQGLPPRA